MSFEEFKRCIYSDVKSFSDERKVETLEKAARLADEYSLANKIFFFFVNKTNPRKPFYLSSGPKTSPSLQSSNSNHNTLKPKPARKNKGHNPLSQSICNYCGQFGHTVTYCPNGLLIFSKKG